MSRKVLLALPMLLLTPLAASAAAPPTYTWTMDVSGANSSDVTGTRTIALTGGWQSAPGAVGGAVRFTSAPSLGKIATSAADNPGAADFAMGTVFTSDPIPAKNYGGNVIQKGLFADPGQIKLQLSSKYGGSSNCRIKGVNGGRLIESTVNVDDGGWHYALCWKEGSQVGITVDGIDTVVAWNPGSISNSRIITIGNKSSTAGSRDQHYGRNDCSVYTIGLTARVDAEALLTTSC